MAEGRLMGLRPALGRSLYEEYNVQQAPLTSKPLGHEPILIKRFMNLIAFECA